MGRTLRVQTPDHVYHVINRGNRKMTVFQDEGDFAFMRGLIVKAKKRYSIRLYNYVFMSNHIHLLVEPLEEGSLAGFMQFLLSKYAIRQNAKYGFSGHVWQGRYRSYLVEEDSYFLQCGKYIELNPVRGCLAKQPEDYAWSSYRYHALGVPDVLVDGHGFYESLGSDNLERRANYRKLFADDLFRKQ